MSEHTQVSGHKIQDSDPTSQSLLRRFRSVAKKRIPLHPLERAVLLVVAVHVCFLPWAIGTMHAWSQVTSLVFSSVGFLLALCPRTYSGDYTLPGREPIAARSHEERGEGAEPLPATAQAPSPLHSPSSSGFRSQASAFRLNPLPRLLRFPLFWAGLLLLSYMAVQGFNPSWVWERNEFFHWLRRVNDVAWLPTSIDTPFEIFNLWRQFIIYASAWLTVCTVWVGLTRRRSFEILLLTVLGNGLALMLFGGLQVLTGRHYLHDLLDVQARTGSFASFVYHNHAGAYIALVVSLAVAFAVHHAFRRTDTSRRSSPAPLFLLAAAVLAVTVVLTRSRGATITLAGFGLLATLLVGLPGMLRRPAGAGNRVVMVAVASLFAVMLSLSIYWLNFGSVVKKFERALEQREAEASISSRLLAHQAAFEMLKENGARGVGAGGFRHLFPKYVTRYPEIASINGRTAVWEHAHNDWLEIPIEQGVAGTLLLLAGSGYLLWGLFKNRIWRNPLAFTLVLGCGQTLVHAWFDFPFQNPAIICSWLVLVITSLRWLELDGAR